MIRTRKQLFEKLSFKGKHMRRDRKNFMNMLEHWRMYAMRLCRCSQKLEEAGMQKLFDEIEMPDIPCAL